MSTLHDRSRPCPQCGRACRHEVVVSLNPKGRPDLRQAILDGSFQRVSCPHCGGAFRIQDAMVYLDFQRRIWIGCFTPEQEPSWATLEREPQDRFRQSMLTHAPPVAREMAGGFRVRAVFGVDALREKLLVLEQGLPELPLELLKLDLMRAGGAAFHPSQRPRLFAVDPEHLHLGRPDGSTLACPRRRLQPYLLEPLRWVSLSERLDRGPYKDLGRLFLPPH